MLRKIADGFFLIGVAHVLPGSIQEVRETIKRERPEIVAVELCPARYAVLSGNPPPQLGPRKLGNPMALALTWLLSLIQTKFARETGSPTGAEMLAAVGEAKAVGARIELIDRDIRVTLHRLNSLMPLSERVKLTFQMLFTMLLPKGKLDINKLTEDEVVRQLLQGFYKLSPTTYRVMIEERDDYMAKQLIPLLESRRRVVCVVGAGHVLGLERRLREALKEFERRIWWSSSLEFEYVW